MSEDLAQYLAKMDKVLENPEYKDIYSGMVSAPLTVQLHSGGRRRRRPIIGRKKSKRIADILTRGRRYNRSEAIKSIRHVRTPEGAERFDQPIGTVITPDLPGTFKPHGRHVRDAASEGRHRVPHFKIGDSVTDGQRNGKVTDRQWLMSWFYRVNWDDGTEELLHHERAAQLHLKKGLELKVVRHVRTPAGRQRFDQPIGTIIVRDRPLLNLKLSKKKSKWAADGWTRVDSTDGGTYEIGYDPDEKEWVAVDDKDRFVLGAKTEDAVWKALDDRLGPTGPQYNDPPKKPVDQRAEREAAAERAKAKREAARAKTKKPEPEDDPTAHKPFNKMTDDELNRYMVDTASDIRTLERLNAGHLSQIPELRKYREELKKAGAEYDKRKAGGGRSPAPSARSRAQAGAAAKRRAAQAEAVKRNAASETTARHRKPLDVADLKATGDTQLQAMSEQYGNALADLDKAGDAGFDSEDAMREHRAARDDVANNLKKIDKVISDRKKANNRQRYNAEDWSSRVYANLNKNSAVMRPIDKATLKEGDDASLRALAENLTNRMQGIEATARGNRGRMIGGDKARYDALKNNLDAIKRELATRYMGGGSPKGAESKLPKVGDKVRISNGGTYDGKEVEVLEVQPDGTLITKHPTNPRNRMRLKPARGVAESQYETIGDVEKPKKSSSPKGNDLVGATGKPFTVIKPLNRGNGQVERDGRKYSVEKLRGGVLEDFEITDDENGNKVTLRGPGTLGLRIERPRQLVEMVHRGIDQLQKMQTTGAEKTPKKPANRSRAFESWDKFIDKQNWTDEEKATARSILASLSQRGLNPPSLSQLKKWIEQYKPSKGLTFDEFEKKVVRHVRTRAGVERFDQMIGSIIVRDLPLKNLKESGKSKWPGWSRLKGSNGKFYEVGKDPDEGDWVGLDSGNKVVASAANEEGVYKALDDFVGKGSSGVRRPVRKPATKPATRPPTAPPAPKVGGTTARGKAGEVSGSFVDATPQLIADMKKYHKFSIPPAWTNVRINPEYKDPHVRALVNGKVIDQRTGKPKTQWLYSEFHRTSKDAEKFVRVERLAKRLPELDAKVKKDWKNSPAAAVVMLMRETGVRVDSQESGKIFGGTTLQARHIKMSGNSATLDFIGKENIRNIYKINNPEVLAMLRQYTKGKTGNDRIFQTKADDTSKYIKAATGEPDAINHDLRTHLANVIALAEIKKKKKPTTKTEFAKLRKEVATTVSEQLNNKPEQALKSYINDMVFDAWRAGTSW